MTQRLLPSCSKASRACRQQGLGSVHVFPLRGRQLGKPRLSPRGIDDDNDATSTNNFERPSPHLSSQDDGYNERAFLRAVQESNSQSKNRAGSTNGTSSTASPVFKRGTMQASTPRAGPVFNGSNLLQEFWGRLLYSYYNWRQDTLSDLVLICLINIGIILLGTAVDQALVDRQHTVWTNMYDVAAIILAQTLPSDTSSIAKQIFSLVMAVAGLAGFALVLALAEQVILELLEDNVARGSAVYEEGHILVLGWGKSQRDIEVVWKMLEQLCLAYKCEGGTTLVVMTQRGKLEMEAFFRRALPPEQRYGTRIVFRQGSPLVSDDLDLVRASCAACVVIISDQSVPPDEADAQSIRAAVLLDELDCTSAAERGSRGAANCKVSTPGSSKCNNAVVVVEIKTFNAIPLLRYSSSPRVLPIPAARFDAMRIARMVHTPILSIVTNQLWNFAKPSQTYIHCFPELCGREFGELPYLFPDAVVFGVLDNVEGQVRLLPPPDYMIGPTDELIIMRPTSVSFKTYRPRAKGVGVVDAADDWEPDYSRPLLSTTPSIRAGACSRKFGAADDLTVDLTKLFSSLDDPLAADSTEVVMQQSLVSGHDSRVHVVLLCGWGEEWFMVHLLRELDLSMERCPPGCQVVCVNNHSASSTVDSVRKYVHFKYISVTHVQADPIRRMHLLRANINISRFTAAVIVCDHAWVRKGEAEGGFNPGADLDVMEQTDVLRLDSMVMMVQLNLRKLLEDQNAPDITIIAEKVGLESFTRFEDVLRLPLGASVNSNAFSATLLTQVAYCPKVLLTWMTFPHYTLAHVIEASHYCRQGEKVSYWRVLQRATRMGHCLMGYVKLPRLLSERTSVVINPLGDMERSKARVWNDGSLRLKFVVLIRREDLAKHGSGNDLSSEGSSVLVNGVAAVTAVEPEPAVVLDGLVA